MESTIFFVNNSPYCFWDKDLKSRNLTFIENLEANYFEFQANYLLSSIESDETTDSEKSHLSITLRNTYSHSLESFFAILLAAIQAPDLVPAWLLKYKNRDLYKLVDKIQEGKFFRNKLGLKECSFKKIADVILSINLEDKEKQKNIKNKFASLWNRFASDFSKKSFQDEYNSIKHGFRITEGGFDLRFTKEEKPGETPEDAEFRTLGSSKYGSTYFVTEQVSPNKPHYMIHENNRNWSLKRYARELVLVSNSINNIQTFIKLKHGKKENYSIPQDLSFLDVYLEDSSGVTDFNFRDNYKFNDEALLGREELIKSFDEVFQP